MFKTSSGAVTVPERSSTLQVYIFTELSDGLKKLTETWFCKEVFSIPSSYHFSVNFELSKTAFTSISTDVIVPVASEV